MGFNSLFLCSFRVKKGLNCVNSCRGECQRERWASKGDGL